MKVTRKFKANNPMGFGLPSDYQLIFEQTGKGYKAPVDEFNWIGMPSSIIEHSLSFTEIIPKPKRERVKAVLIKPKFK